MGALKRALWVYLFNSGSCNGCDIENVALITPRYDAERFGIKVVGSPRHADVLFVTGPVTKKLAPRLRLVYEQMPEPRLVVAVGACAVSGGVFYDSYTLCGPADQVLPVDVYVPGERTPEHGKRCCRSWKQAVSSRGVSAGAGSGRSGIPRP